MPTRPFSRSRFAIFSGLGLLFLCALTVPLGKGHAMGTPAPQHNATNDIATPISGVQGHVARDDTQPLNTGRLRVYTSTDATAPASIQEQAKLIRPLLTGLTSLPALSDVTDRARDLGITPQALAKSIHGMGKYTQPNSIQALDAGGKQPAVVLARIAADAPQAAVNVSLYCLNSSNRDAITISHFGPISPQYMIKIKEKICAPYSD